MRKKFKVRYIVIPLLCVAIAGGGIAAIVTKRHSDTVAQVVNATELDYSFYSDGGSENSYWGSLKKGSVLNVKIDSDLEIEEVKVEKGDTVKKGDTLLTYNTDSLKINVEEIESSIKQIENQEKIAQNELDVLKKLLPSEDAPTQEDLTDIPETYDEANMSFAGLGGTELKFEEKISEKSKPVSGTGTKEEPFVFYAAEKTVVTKDYLNYLSGGAANTSEKVQSGDEMDSDNTASAENASDGAKYALLHVYSESGVMLYSRFIDGSLINQNDIADWTCNSGVTLNEDGSLYFEQSQTTFAKVITYTQSGALSDFDTDSALYGDIASGEDYYYNIPTDLGENTEQSNINATDEITLNDNYVYSKEELKTMISEKEKELEDLALSKKQANINLRTAEKRLETGAEIAEISGTITFVAKDKKHLSENGAYIIITNDNGMSIACTIGEFSLNTIEEGMDVSIVDYNDNSDYSGIITSISDTPSQESDSLYTDATTQSYYEFIVTVDEEFELSEDSSVEVIPNIEGVGDIVCIDAAFVREENGNFYVMVANENDVLEKRYVEIGKKYYGLAIEIKKGLSWSDRLAFPYGDVYEGMPVEEVDYMTFIYGGLF